MHRAGVAKPSPYIGGTFKAVPFSSNGTAGIPVTTMPDVELPDITGLMAPSECP